MCCPSCLAASICFTVRALALAASCTRRLRGDYSRYVLVIDSIALARRKSEQTESPFSHFDSFASTCPIQQPRKRKGQAINLSVYNKELHRSQNKKKWYSTALRGIPTTLPRLRKSTDCAAQSVDCAVYRMPARSIECCAFYRMALILAIPRLRSAFYRMRKSTDCAEHIYVYISYERSPH